MVLFSDASPAFRLGAVLNLQEFFLVKSVVRGTTDLALTPLLKICFPVHGTRESSPSLISSKFNSPVGGGKFQDLLLCPKSSKNIFLQHGQGHIFDCFIYCLRVIPPTYPRVYCPTLYNLYFKKVTPITMKSVLPSSPLKTKLMIINNNI